MASYGGLSSSSDTAPGSPGSHGSRDERTEGLPERGHCQSPTPVEVQPQSEVAPETRVPITHRFAVGGDHIPPSPLELKYVRVLLACSVCQIIAGTVLFGVGVVISGLTNHRAQYETSSPSLWWAGVLPTTIGGCGIYAGIRKNRKYLYRWGLAGILVALTQTALLGVVGSFIPALYNVWPNPMSTHKGHPVCKTMVDRCYCQDYYHGKWSAVELAGVQYIHEDVRWKDTGYAMCHDVIVLTFMYYSAMAMVGLFLLVTMLGWIVSLAGSVCAPQNMKFHRLDESAEVEENTDFTESVMDTHS